jgi:hypothetical protein
MLSSELMNRHDDAKNDVVEWLNTIGAPAQPEPRDPADPRGTRADILVDIDGVRTLVDIVISHPLAPSHRHRASTAPLAVATQAAKDKHRKHGDQARTRGCQFVAFSLESFGGWHVEAADFIRSMIASCSRRQHIKWAPREVVKGIHGILAMSVCRGNARAVRACARGALV